MTIEQAQSIRDWLIDTFNQKNIQLDYEKEIEHDEKMHLAFQCKDGYDGMIYFNLDSEKLDMCGIYLITIDMENNEIKLEYLPPITVFVCPKECMIDKFGNFLETAQEQEEIYSKILDDWNSEKHEGSFDIFVFNDVTKNTSWSHYKTVLTTSFDLRALYKEINSDEDINKFKDSFINGAFSEIGEHGCRVAVVAATDRNEASYKFQQQYAGEFFTTDRIVEM